MIQIPKLSPLDLKIMNVLWNSDKDLTGPEIAQCLEEDGISYASVNQSVKKLLKKGVVEIVSYTLVARTYSRVYHPCYSKEEYLISEYSRLNISLFKSKKMRKANLLSALIENSDYGVIDEADINELQEIIDKKRAELIRERKI